jgi:nucleoside-diphosphate-sugar epimerase
MKVLVTGASGFVGAHTVRAVLDAGHDVRASARSADRIRRALAPLGCADAVEIVTADMTSAGEVRHALVGCDAVVHSAAVHSRDVRRRRVMLTANPWGTELVLGQGSDLGLDPVIHVSSYAALLPAHGILTPDSPVGDPSVPHARSKAHSERIARRLQGAGAPVTIIYPGMVWGPDDPASGESTRLARTMAGGAIPVALPGAIPVVDVRDVARVHAAALRPGAGPRRYLAAAQTLTLTDLRRLIRPASGRRPAGGTPPPLLLPLGRLADIVHRRVSRRLPFDHEGPWTVAHCPAIDTTATTRDLGVDFRSATRTVHDTLRWMAGLDQEVYARS